MKAAILKGYDKNGCDLEIRDIPIPKISEKEVLVKIQTVVVQSTVWALMDMNPNSKPFEL